MASSLCSHTDEIRSLMDTSNSRLRQRTPVTGTKPLAEVALEIRERCGTECGDASPYPADARRVEEGQDDQAEQEVGR